MHTFKAENQPNSHSLHLETNLYVLDWLSYIIVVVPHSAADHLLFLHLIVMKKVECQLLNGKSRQLLDRKMGRRLLGEMIPSFSGACPDPLDKKN